MKKEEIEKRYNKMVSGIEEAGIYDGRGTYDLYECEKCGHSIITTYAVKGVTPFIIRCKGCGGDMIHEKTYKSIPEAIYAIKWVRPTLKQTMGLSTGLIEHVLNGGLVMETELKINNIMNSKRLTVEAEKAYYAYREKCEKVAKAAQGYINWSDDVGCEYMSSDGLCILTTASDYYANGSMPESVCPESEFFSFVKDKDEITEQEFKSICI